MHLPLPPAYSDLVFDPSAEGDLRVIGEFLCVLETTEGPEPKQEITARLEKLLHEVET